MFEFAWPWVFLAIPLPIIFWKMYPRYPNQLSLALKVPFFHELAEQFKDQKLGPTSSKYLIYIFIIWILLILSLAGPRWIGPPEPVTKEGYHIMLALDISASMALNDMSIKGKPVSRLTVVKKTAEQFVKDRTEDSIGLILFGTRAYLQTPLTFDRHTILLRLKDATVGLAGQTTSIGDAIGLAIKRLANVPKEGRIIILLTDGVNNSGVLSPLKAAQLANSENIKIYTIGLGADENNVPLGLMMLNMNGQADLDEETLKKVAKMTGGQYFRATNIETLHQIYQQINKIEKQKQKRPELRPVKDYYIYPLMLALLLFGLLLFDVIQRGFIHSLNVRQFK